MTLAELEVLVKQIQKQVELNTLAIQQMNNNLAKYATLDSVYAMKTTISLNSGDINALEQQVATLSSSIGVVNKLSKLLDTNIKDVTKNDILQYDGDRWTNVKPAAVGIGSGGSGVNTLEALLDVKITNKTDKQSLCWDNASGKWINYTVTGGGSSGGGLDAAAMWAELAKSSSNTIHPSHIKGNLTLTGLSVNGNTVLKNSNTTFSVLTTGVSINGSAVATGEITAYGI